MGKPHDQHHQKARRIVRVAIIVQRPVALARFEQIVVGQQAFTNTSFGGSNCNITAMSFGYRWYPIMFSRAGVALDGEFARVRTIGQEPLSGDGTGAVFNPTGAVWSNSYYFGIDFDF